VVSTREMLCVVSAVHLDSVLCHNGETFVIILSALDSPFILVCSELVTIRKV